MFCVKLIQAQDRNTEKVWRINFLNPAVELELPTGKNSTFSGGLGVSVLFGYFDNSYRKGIPFADIQQKWFYNFKKRQLKNKKTAYNSANFVSLRFLYRGYDIVDNRRYNYDCDFAIAPTWGIQRHIGKSFHILFDIGTVYYFNKNWGRWYPITFQLNLGFDLCAISNEK